MMKLSTCGFTGNVSCLVYPDTIWPTTQSCCFHDKDSCHFSYLLWLRECILSNGVGDGEASLLCWKIFKPPFFNQLRNLTRIPSPCTLQNSPPIVIIANWIASIIKQESLFRLCFQIPAAIFFLLSTYCKRSEEKWREVMTCHLVSAEFLINCWVGPASDQHVASTVCSTPRNPEKTAELWSHLFWESDMTLKAMLFNHTLKRPLRLSLLALFCFVLFAWWENILPQVKVIFQMKIRNG